MESWNARWALLKHLRSDCMAASIDCIINAAIASGLGAEFQNKQVSNALSCCPAAALELDVLHP